MAIDLTAEIEKAMKEQMDVVNEVVNKAVDKVSKETVNDLKSSSPRKSGKYAAGWKNQDGQTATRGKLNIIYNGSRAGLTHLLEFGHAKVSGGRVAAKPHIADVEQKAIKNLEDEIRKEVENG